VRIWDIHPGYLARQQLLGEHCELHGLFNIHYAGKKGYSHHPETLRWTGCLPALYWRHQILTCEMQLRGYHHRSPLPEPGGETIWPLTFIDTPARQFELLADKYASDHRSGRIPLPANTQQLWAQHKYSVMAVEPRMVREIGAEVAHGRYSDDTMALSLLMVEILRRQPQPGRIMNVLQHMWGYVSGQEKAVPATPEQLIREIRRRAFGQGQQYLLHSTALCDLGVRV